LLDWQKWEAVMTEEEKGPAFLKEEYQALRGEILKRTELQHQLISIALVAFGSLLALGFNKDGSPQATLAYPLLTVALSAAWSQHDIRIRQMGEYIRDKIEPKFLGAGNGWEHYLLTSDAETKRVGKRAQWSTRVILFITPILAVILARFKIGTWVPADAVDRSLTGVGILCIAVTAYLFWRIKSTAGVVKQSPVQSRSENEMGA
jgi:hypothetical protein